MTLLRSLLFNVVYFGSLGLVCLYGIAACRTADQSMELGRFWAGHMVRAARLLCGIRLEVTGREHLPQSGPALIASQHQSAYDTIVWQFLVPRASYVMKQELMRIPLFGRLSILAGMIEVDRTGGAAAIRALIRASKRAVAENRQIVIFPEGTRSESGTVAPLQPGIAAIATATRLPVIPVRTNSGDCWPRQAFAKKAGIVRMDILPPLPANLPRAELMAALTTALAPASALPSPHASDTPPAALGV